MKIIGAISGASGAIYARQLLEALVGSSEVAHIGVVVSKNGRAVYAMELEEELSAFDRKITIYDADDFNAPFASGSAWWDAMVVVPCSVGMLSRVATGVSDSLMSRAADVMLKERRRVIFLVRETPLSLIHIENMRQVTLSGGIVMPASPSFYGPCGDVETLCHSVTSRILSLLGIQERGVYRWGE